MEVPLDAGVNHIVTRLYTDDRTLFAEGPTLSLRRGGRDRRRRWARAALWCWPSASTPTPSPRLNLRYAVRRCADGGGDAARPRRRRVPRDPDHRADQSRRHPRRRSSARSTRRRAAGAAGGYLRALHRGPRHAHRAGPALPLPAQRRLRMPAAWPRCAPRASTTARWSRRWPAFAPATPSCCSTPAIPASSRWTACRPRERDRPLPARRLHLRAGGVGQL